jgi:hypothetical protein
MTFINDVRNSWVLSNNIYITIFLNCSTFNHSELFSEFEQYLKATGYHLDRISTGKERDNTAKDFNVTIEQALIALLERVMDQFEDHDRQQ